MESKVCPICGARIKGNMEDHIKYMHPEEIAKQEMEMLDEMARQQQEVMKEMRERYPGIYNEFLEELAKDDSREIKMICANEYLSMNEIEKAEKLFTQMLDNADAEVYNGLGICCRRKGDYDKAIDFFKKAIDCGEVETSVANICDIYEEEGKFYEEEKFLKELLKKHENGYLYALHSRILTMIGKYEDAEKIATKAIGMGEDDGYIYLAFSLIMQGKEEKAEEILREFNEKHPDRLHSYILLANIYMERNVEKAEEYLNILYEKTKDPFILDYLISSFLNIGKMERAEEIIKEALKLHHLPQYHLLYGIILLMKGDDEEKEFEKFIEAFPSKEAYIKVIDIYIDAENYGKAWKYLKKAEIIYGSDEIFKCIRGNILFQEEKIDEALEEYEASIGVKENIDAYIGMIKCFMKKGDIRKAIEACHKAILITDDEELQNELRYLINKMGG